jgi:NAD(P)H-hydrate epimerase
MMASWHPGILASWHPGILASWHPGILASWHAGIACYFEGSLLVAEHLVLSCEQVRQIDRVAIDELNMPGLVLMENAGRGIALLMQREGLAGRVLIACGPGNNGGDGFVVARHLDLGNVEVHVALACDPGRLSGDAAANFAWLGETGVQIHRVDQEWPAALEWVDTSCDWVVDALLGTGVRGAPRAPLDRVIERLNQIPARHLAVDIPSGLDAESGEAARTTFRADLTATMVAAKPGLLAPAAAPYVGRLEVLEIGVPLRVLQRFGLRPDCGALEA